MNNAATHLKRRIGQSFIGLFSVLLILGTIFVFESYAQAHEGSETIKSATTQATDQANSSKAMWAFIAAAVSFGLGALGAGIAISSVGAAAMGAVAEKPEIAGQALIFVALAEGLVVFGFIMGLLILGKI